MNTMWNHSVVKEVACAKPSGAPGTNCCVRKYIDLGPDQADVHLTKTERSGLEGILASL